jgi:hypothetical protein
VRGNKPEQIVFDGGFSSRDNLEQIKALGIRDVAFSKAPGLSIKEMVRRTWLYQGLRFRAGIEGVISFLKRCFGWDRCAWVVWCFSARESLHGSRGPRRKILTRWRPRPPPGRPETAAPKPLETPE